MRVLVYDRRRLRGAGLVAYLAPWALTQGLDIAEISERKADQQIFNDACAVIISESALGEFETIPPELENCVQPDNPPLIVISDCDRDEHIMRWMRLGAYAFVPTSAPPEFALNVISFVMEGGSYFPISALRSLFHTDGPEPHNGDVVNNDCASETPCAAESPSDGDEACKAGLTAREGQVLELLKNGEPNKVIARRLGTTEGTVKLHVRQIMRKLGATNRTQAAVTAQLYDKAADRIYEIESDASSHSALSE